MEKSRNLSLPVVGRVMENSVNLKYVWTVGDTTVRNPHRFRGALMALVDSPLNGNMLDGESKNEFAKLLHREGVIYWKGVVQGRDMRGDAGKWCMALSRLGLITPRLTRDSKMDGSYDPALQVIVEDVDGLSGRPYEVTPAGQQLIASESLLAQQECFLRALVCYRTPSPLTLAGGKTTEERFESSFLPLKFVLDIIHLLRESSADPIITASEYAFFVQTLTPDDGVEKVVDSIMKYRSERERRKGSIAKYDQELASQIAKRFDKSDVGILDDLKTRTHCALMHFRSTGVFQTSSGRGIEITKSHEVAANLLRERYPEHSDFEDFLRTQIRGAILPTDSKANSLFVIQDLKKKISDRSIEYGPPEVDESMSLQHINRVRNDLKEKLREIMEGDFAKSQSEEIEEILGYLRSIPNKGSFKMSDGTTVSIPTNERATYLEWAVWRAFLAIGGLRNSPQDARRFEIDQDFMPIRFAPGGGPDMHFEFDDAVVVVEVTLTESSRQEAVEGEPVRRHVADYFKKFGGKTVYGLFIAPKIDSNTAHTFLDGIWFLPDDSRIDLDIVPVSLDDFTQFLRIARSGSEKAHKKLLRAMHDCRNLAKREREAPRWKSAVSCQFIRSAQEHSPSDFV